MSRDSPIHLTPEYVTRCALLMLTSCPGSGVLMLVTTVTSAAVTLIIV